MLTWLACRIPPPLLALLCGWGMAQLAASWPQWSVALPPQLRTALLLALLLMAILLEGSAVWAFVRQRTTISPLQPQRSTVLVLTGFYRFSRNPMYLGMLCVLLAWALWLGHWLALAGPPGFVLWLNHFQIAPEERALQARFGVAYTAYCQRVRRWL
ncbi:isoprenylcysteine carboxylmethyltransferase family protein [Vogesella sp. DC21W]|uniref:Isoprenylcysteine carboxylmethyltransferase family protein n=1 Tax=Vogesella aquatica TaxID=2984206 RepID=A0ABT5IXQ2_9NEIS|nr:isoprenylcysteine carboxylmethyltransferase family protein [Vogesella aquatica]MDC7717346.1 isoprenylcysteine carboxylmethyltransferase family protein [Vogesella aquatica]